ncbi:hypothetical protein SRB17_36340 [Streptomyces sp. RB17]|nr:hypothetical protein [Streptomyces sp. RB17]
MTNLVDTERACAVRGGLPVGTCLGAFASSVAVPERHERSGVWAA